MTEREVHLMAMWLMQFKHDGDWTPYNYPGYEKESEEARRYAKEILARLRTHEQGEPVAWAPYMEDEDIPTPEGGLLYEGHTGRIIAYRTEQQVRDSMVHGTALPLYASPTPTQATEEIEGWAYEGWDNMSTIEITVGHCHTGMVPVYAHIRPRPTDQEKDDGSV